MLGTFINPVIVLLVEIFKLTISLVIVFYYRIRIKWRQSYLFFVLTLIYYISNNLYLVSFKYASAPAIQLLLYVKLPATVFLHHCFIKRQTRSYPVIDTYIYSFIHFKIDTQSFIHLHSSILSLTHQYSSLLGVVDPFGVSHDWCTHLSDNRQV